MKDIKNPKEICYHIHTHNSQCAKEEMTLVEIIERLKRHDIKIAALSDHVYDDSIKHVVHSQQEALKEIDSDIDVYLCVEAESHEPGKYSVDKIAYEECDFTLLSINHSGSFAASVRKYGQDVDGFIKHYGDLFLGASELKGLRIIVHPLLMWHVKFVFGREFTQKEYDKFYNYISDKVLNEGLKKFAENDIAIEISGKSTGDFLKPYYKDLYKRALSAGVKISVGADAHSLSALEISDDVFNMIDELNIKKENLFIPFAAPKWRG